MPSSTLIADAKWGIFFFWWKITTLCSWAIVFGKLQLQRERLWKDKREDFYN